MMGTDNQYTEDNMAIAKKRTVDQENRQFKSNWTEPFSFISPDNTKANATC